MMEQFVHQVKKWMLEAGELLRNSLENIELEVGTKTSHKDLVTNFDRQVQEFLIEKITNENPKIKILAEEDGKDDLEDFSGTVLVIDPIDGTMNFILEKRNFCIMVAIWESGREVAGFIYNVMGNEFLWGGPHLGVYLNENKIEAPKDLELTEGLFGVNAGMYVKNHSNAQKMGERALGVRMTGCAGIELSNIILGRRCAYMSYLAPWDYSAALILFVTLGLKLTKIDGRPLDHTGRTYILAGTPNAQEELLKIVEGKII